MDNLITFAPGTNPLQYGEFEKYTRPITRGETARIITRALPSDKLQGVAATKLKDVGDIPLSLRNYVISASNTGIVKGYPDNTFKYNNQASRAEAVVMVSRMLDIK